MKEQISIDWFPEDRDGFMKFQVRVSHGDQHNSIDFKIQPSLLSEIEHRQLDPFLNHNASTDIDTIVWLLDTSLRQQRPEFSYQDRNAEMRRLLSSCRLLPSLREIYIETAGRNLLQKRGYGDWHERSKFSPYFDDIYRSQQTAFGALNLGTPKLKNISPAEAEELDLFCCELMGGDDVSRTLKKYDALITRRSKDKVFVRWLGKTLQNIGRETLLPVSFRFALKYYIICGWTHGFLWGFDNVTRADALLRLYGAPGVPVTRKQQEQGAAEQTQLSVDPEVIRKIVKRSGLKGYSDFPEAYHRQAPFKLILGGTGEQEWFQIDFSSLEKFPLPRAEE
jgi:hypothetical protein